MRRIDHLVASQLEEVFVRSLRMFLTALVLAGASLASGVGCSGGGTQIPLADVPPTPPPADPTQVPANAPPPGQRSPDVLPE